MENGIAKICTLLKNLLWISNCILHGTKLIFIKVFFKIKIDKTLYSLSVQYRLILNSSREFMDKRFVNLKKKIKIFHYCLNIFVMHKLANSFQVLLAHGFNFPQYVHLPRLKSFLPLMTSIDQRIFL